ncbi:MAG: hypothetical protein ACXVB9_20150 [Bdellovibrionota bacterium]
MSRALRFFFTPPVFVAIVLSRLVDSKDRKVSKGGDRRKSDRRKTSR